MWGVALTSEKQIPESRVITSSVAVFVPTFRAVGPAETREEKKESRTSLMSQTSLCLLANYSVRIQQWQPIQ